MNDVHMLYAMQEMIYYVVIGVCVVSVPMLFVGIALSIIQTATSINEMTLTFIPKFLVMFTLIFFLCPWFMEKLIYILQKYLTHLPDYIK